MFSPEQRSIYSPQLPSGRQVGRFDPLAVRRELLLVTQDRINELLDAYGQPAADPDHPVREERLAWARAEKDLAAAARAAFGFAPVTAADGVTDAEALEVLYDFLDYLGKPAATGNGSPATSPSAERAG